MSASRCLDLTIGALPREQWAAAIAELPEHCQHPTACTVRVGCRAYVGDYYRMQWRIHNARERARAHLRGIMHVAR